jgi:hypothetical protein
LMELMFQVATRIGRGECRVVRVQLFVTSGARSRGGGFVAMVTPFL